MACYNALTPISFVNGPPGTGKTTTLTAIIENCLHRNQGVLVIAERNFAVNNIYQSVLKNTSAKEEDLHVIVSNEYLIEHPETDVSEPFHSKHPVFPQIVFCTLSKAVVMIVKIVF